MQGTQGNDCLKVKNGKHLTGMIKSNKQSPSKGNPITLETKINGTMKNLGVILPNKIQQNILYRKDCQKV